MSAISGGGRERERWRGVGSEFLDLCRWRGSGPGEGGQQAGGSADGRRSHRERGSIVHNGGGGSENLSQPPCCRWRGFAARPINFKTGVPDQNKPTCLGTASTVPQRSGGGWCVCWLGGRGEEWRSQGLSLSSLSVRSSLTFERLITGFIGELS